MVQLPGSNTRWHTWFASTTTGFSLKGTRTASRFTPMAAHSMVHNRAMSKYNRKERHTLPSNPKVFSVRLTGRRLFGTTTCMSTTLPYLKLSRFRDGETLKPRRYSLLCPAYLLKSLVLFAAAAPIFSEDEALLTRLLHEATDLQR